MLTEHSLDFERVAVPFELQEVLTPQARVDSRTPIVFPTKLLNRPGQKKKEMKSFYSPRQLINQSVLDENQNYSFSTRKRNLRMIVAPPKSPSEEAASNLKKLVTFRRFVSRSPEDRVPGAEISENVVLRHPNPPGPLTRTPITTEILHSDAKLKMISLNEMITIRKLRDTLSGGSVKKMLHASSMNIYEIQVQ